MAADYTLSQKCNPKSDFTFLRKTITLPLIVLASVLKDFDMSSTSDSIRWYLYWTSMLRLNKSALFLSLCLNSLIAEDLRKCCQKSQWDPYYIFQKYWIPYHWILCNRTVAPLPVVSWYRCYYLVSQKVDEKQQVVYCAFFVHLGKYYLTQRRRLVSIIWCTIYIIIYPFISNSGRFCLFSISGSKRR